MPTIQERIARYTQQRTREQVALRTEKSADEKRTEEIKGSREYATVIDLLHSQEFIEALNAYLKKYNVTLSQSNIDEYLRIDINTAPSAVEPIRVTFVLDLSREPYDEQDMQYLKFSLSPIISKFLFLKTIEIQIYMYTRGGRMSLAKFYEIIAKAVAYDERLEQRTR